MKADEFKVGDIVYCSNYGKGKVKYISMEPYPVTVEFFNRNSTFTRGYTQDGKYVKEGLRTLFFEEIKIPESAYKRPKWRAETLDSYYAVSGIGIVIIYKELLTFENEKHFEAGNYFQTEEEAKESKFYKVFHEEE